LDFSSFNPLRAAKKYRQLNRRSIVFLLLVILIGTIFFLNIGGSETQDFDTTGETPELIENPSQADFSFPDGFNFSQAIGGQLTPPSDFDPDLIPPGGFINGSFDGDFSVPSLPDFTPPDITVPTFSPPTITPPGNTGPTGTATDPGFNNTRGDNNVTLIDRQDKARNLPNITIPGFDLFNFDLPTFSIDFQFSLLSALFLILMFGLLYFNKMLLPDLLSKLSNDDGSTTFEKTFFVHAPGITEDQKEKIERARRLVIFKDHVDELIERSRIRIDEEGPDLTIVKGYHELDKAFASFSKLIRDKSVTPLEHARTNFETGEIDNQILEEIVNLFYLNRFGYRKMTKNDGYDFIDNLIKLVIKDISEENGI